MLSSTSFNRYGRKIKMGFGRRYYKTNFKNRCRRHRWNIIFNDFKQDDRLKMNRFNRGCKNVVINHSIYVYDTIISDIINYDDMYKTLDMVARHY